MPRRFLVWPLMGVLILNAWAPAGLAYDVLANPVEMLKSAQRVDFVGTNKFTPEMSTKGAVLRTTPRGSACGLYQRVDMDGRRLQHIRWIWRVDRLHRTADIRDLRKEDFGAKVMFIFGEPSLFNRDLPTLVYVWTSTPVANGTVISSQRYGSLAYVQLRGRDEIGRWQQEERNVTEDFKAVFGREPGRLRYIAIFNDNDQTAEAASALLGPILDVK